jgi:hypothetical protein
MNLKEKTVVIDNKTHRYSKIVMLSACNKSNIAKTDKFIKNTLELRMVYSSTELVSNILNQIHPQHLYFLSTDKICVGDWCIRNTQVFKATNIIDGDIEFIDEDGQLMYYWNWACTKIIASTDPSLNLPKPSEQFLQVYIDCFNKNEKIEEYLVEYIANAEPAIDWEWKDTPKITKGEITIKKVKTEYSEQEMFLNMQYYMEYCERNGYVTPKDWLEKYKHF